MKVSLIIGVYNGEPFLRESLASVFAQTRPVDEIIVVDDASTDGTAAILAEVADRLRLIRFPENRGLGAARAVGLAAVSHELVCFHDADDLWPPTKNALTMDVMQCHPECDLLFGDMVNFEDQTGAREPRSALTRATTLEPCIARTEGDLLWLDPDKLFGALIGGCFFHIPTVTAKTALLRQAGGFDPEFRRAQDVDLWYRVATGKPQVCGVRQLFLLRRLHQHNLVHDTFRGDLFKARALAKVAAFARTVSPAVARLFRQRHQAALRQAAMGALRRGDQPLARQLFRESLKVRLNGRDPLFWASTFAPRCCRQGLGRCWQRLTGRHVSES